MERSGAKDSLVVLPEYIFGVFGSFEACFVGFVIFKKRSSLPKLCHRSSCCQVRILLRGGIHICRLDGVRLAAISNSGLVHAVLATQ
jgi:hypothetical protein